MPPPCSASWFHHKRSSYLWGKREHTQKRRHSHPKLAKDSIHLNEAVQQKHLPQPARVTNTAKAPDNNQCQELL